MTGPEHYQEAERLIRIAREAAPPQNRVGKDLYRDSPTRIDKILAEAQVHAILAYL